MRSEAGFGTAAVRYVSVGTGFRGPSGPPTVGEPATDGHGPAHGRGPRRPRTGPVGVVTLTVSRPDSRSDLQFQDSSRTCMTGSTCRPYRRWRRPPWMSLEPPRRKTRPGARG